MCKLVFVSGWKCTCEVKGTHFPEKFIRVCDDRMKDGLCMPSRNLLESSEVPWVCPECHLKLVRDELAPLFQHIQCVTKSVTDFLIDNIPVDDNTHPAELPLRDDFERQAQTLKVGAYQLARKLHALRANAYHNYLGDWEWRKKVRKIVPKYRDSFMHMATIDANHPFREIEGVSVDVGLPMHPDSSVLGKFEPLPDYFSLTHTANFPPFSFEANTQALADLREEEEANTDPVFTLQLLELYIKSLQREMEEINRLQIKGRDLNANLAEMVDQGAAWDAAQRRRRDTLLPPPAYSEQSNRDGGESGVRTRGQIFRDMARKRDERAQLMRERIPWLKNWLKIVEERYEMMESIADRLGEDFNEEVFQSRAQDVDVQEDLFLLNVMNLHIVDQGIRAMHVPAFPPDRSLRVRIELVPKAWVDEVLGNWDDLKEVYCDVDADTHLVTAKNAPHYFGSLEDELGYDQERYFRFVYWRDLAVAADTDLDFDNEETVETLHDLTIEEVAAYEDEEIGRGGDGKERRCSRRKWTGTVTARSTRSSWWRGRKERSSTGGKRHRLSNFINDKRHVPFANMAQKAWKSFFFSAKPTIKRQVEGRGDEVIVGV